MLHVQRYKISFDTLRRSSHGSRLSNSASSLAAGGALVTYRGTVEPRRVKVIIRHSTARLDGDCCFNRNHDARESIGSPMWEISRPFGTEFGIIPVCLPTSHRPTCPSLGVPGNQDQCPLYCNNVICRSSFTVRLEVSSARKKRRFIYRQLIVVSHLGWAGSRPRPMGEPSTALLGKMNHREWHRPIKQMRTGVWCEEIQATVTLSADTRKRKGT